MTRVEWLELAGAACISAGTLLIYVPVGLIIIGAFALVAAFVGDR